MIRLEGPTLPDETKGQIVPYLLGQGVHHDVPGLPLQVGFTAQLADNCGIDDLLAVGTIQLSGPNLDDIMGKVPSSGVVQIDAEWFRYSGKLANPWRLIIAVRGYLGTEIATHEKGAEVYFVEGRPIYVFAEAPPGYQYPAGSVLEVRINDVAQVPFYTVRLQDDRIVTGRRFITVEFDLTRSFGGASAPRLPGTAVIAGGSDAEEPETLPSRQIRPIAGGSGVFGPQYGVVYTRKGRGVSLGKGRVVMPPAPPPPPPPVPDGLRTMPRGQVPVAPVSSRPTAVRLLQLPLGRVTADILSLIDTPSGHITGVGSGEMIRPTHVKRLLLEETYGQRDATRYDEPSWDTTLAREVALDLTWRLRWYGEEFQSFRTKTGYCGNADLFLDESGLWRNVFRDSQAPIAATITPREFIGDVVLGMLPPTATTLEVSWGDGVGDDAGAFTLDSQVMRRRVDRISGTLELPYLATESGARKMARVCLSRRDRQRQSIELAVTHAWTALTRTDRVRIESTLVDLYGGAPFEIRGTTDRGDQRVLALVEGDPLALGIPLSGALVAPSTSGVPLIGSLDPGVGEVDFFGAPYFGPSYFGQSYF